MVSPASSPRIESPVRRVIRLEVEALPGKLVFLRESSPWDMILRYQEELEIRLERWRMGRRLPRM
jgi:hypothetical protein